MVNLPLFFSNEPTVPLYQTPKHQRLKWAGCCHETDWIDETRDLIMTYSSPKSSEATEEPISVVFFLICSLSYSNIYDYNITIVCSPIVYWKHCSVPLFLLNNTFYVQTFEFARFIFPNDCKALHWMDVPW